MSSAVNEIVWQHAGVETVFSAERCPLVIGTVSGADIRISGPGGQSLAQIDLVDGLPILQPLLRPSPMSVDGEPLTSTRTLQDGMQLEAFGVVLNVGWTGGTITIAQHSGNSQFETLPPELPDTADEDAPVAAAEWRPGEATVARAQRPVGLYAAIGVALTTLLGIAVWLATSVPVRLETIPAVPASVSVTGPGFSVPFAGRYLLRPGPHTVTLQTPGYRDLVRRVDIGSEPTTLVLEQQPLPGELLVTASFGDASVDGMATLTARDSTTISSVLPVNFSGLQPGVYDVAIAAPGYLEFAASVDVRGLGETQRLDIALIPASAAVSVTTEPAGATVVALADNTELAAATPAVITLPAGRQRVRFELPGYKPVERTYAVFPNTEATANPIVLEPADATLVVQSRPRGASVTVDGRYRGRTPLTLALEPGQRAQLRLTSPGYSAATRSVLLQSDEQRTITVPLTAQLGEITIRTVPVDAVILINGREAGRGTLTVTLPAEPQSITVKREGFVDWRRTVTPRPGFAQTIDAEMVTPQQVADRQFEQQITVANGHELQYVRPGTFRMGTSRRAADRRNNEALRDVRLTAGFYIGKHEVTNEQFAAFRRTHPRGGQVYSAMAGDDNPVVNLSWQDAAAYCNWLSEQEGLEPAYSGKFGGLVPSTSPANGYRLPTEAEWAWVARYAGTEGEPQRFGWGASMPPDEGVANLADEAATGLLTNTLKDYRDGYPATAPVGKFEPNTLGLYDLDGNVSEWVQDWYAATVPDGPLINPKGPAAGTGHVIRGPSWRDSNVQRLRLAFREVGNDAAYDVGFRIVRPVN